MKKLLVLPALALMLFGAQAHSAEENFSQPQMNEQFTPGGSVDAQQAFYARIRCESSGYSTRSCRVRGDMRIQDVRIARQLSIAPCVEGTSWGFNGRGIWVSRGCRADFQVLVYSRYPGYPGNGGGYPHRPGYPGYPGDGGGYPHRPGYPGDNGGYPHRPGYPGDNGGYPGYPGDNGGRDDNGGWNRN